jgi:hypothetical protein
VVAVQTDRDAQIVGWAGALGAAGAEHVMGRFGMGRSWCYARLESLSAGGLLVPRALLYRRPALYAATTEGLRWRGLGRLGICRLGPGGFEHAWQVASVAVALHGMLPGFKLVSEREIRAHERDEQELLASARLGALTGARQQLHRPDLALIDTAGDVYVVEVELSVKARARLQAICTGWARARHIRHTYYLVAPVAAGALTRAVHETRSQDRITILALDDTRALAAAVAGEGSGHVHR